MEIKNVVLLLLFSSAQGKLNMLYRSTNTTSTEWNRFLVGSQVVPSEEFCDGLVHAQIFY